MREEERQLDIGGGYSLNEPERLSLLLSQESEYNLVINDKDITGTLIETVYTANLLIKLIDYHCGC